MQQSELIKGDLLKINFVYDRAYFRIIVVFNVVFNLMLKIQILRTFYHNFCISM